MIQISTEPSVIVYDEYDLAFIDIPFNDSSEYFETFEHLNKDVKFNKVSLQEFAKIKEVADFDVFAITKNPYQRAFEMFKHSVVENKSESKNISNDVSFTNLSRDAKVRFSDLEFFGYAKMLESKDFINIDTVTVANVRWKVSVEDSLVLVRERNLQKWLKQELKVDTVFIRRN